jgi:lysophospholipase L1-like esterase
MDFYGNEKLLFIGDSITDCGRFDPGYAPLGAGYVREFWGLVSARLPHRRLSVVNKGISGNTTRDLKARWEEDVIKEEPDWMFLMIGINDVWRYFDGYPDQHVPLAEFEAIYNELVKPVEGGIVLMSPFLIEPNPKDPFRVMVDGYRAVVKQIAEREHCWYVDLQAAFDEGLKSQPIEYWGPDRVHPTEIGHKLIALEVLRACEIDLLAAR